MTIRFSDYADTIFEQCKSKDIEKMVWPLAQEYMLPQNKDQNANAAVLVPIFKYQQSYYILLTERTQNLTQHAGQISFPGGKIESIDASPEQAAIREAKEETGMQDLQILSKLATINSLSGFRIATYLGLVQKPAQWQPNPVEVANLIDLPMDYLMQTEHFECIPFERDGQEFQYYEINFEGNRIWGFTGSILFLINQLFSQWTTK